MITFNPSLAPTFCINGTQAKHRGTQRVLEEQSWLMPRHHRWLFRNVAFRHSNCFVDAYAPTSGRITLWKMRSKRVWGDSENKIGSGNLWYFWNFVNVSAEEARSKASSKRKSFASIWKMNSKLPEFPSCISANFLRVVCIYAATSDY